MDTKYSNVIDSENVAMMLYGEIGSPSLEYEYFTHEMRYHNAQGKKIKVYINSQGGSVFGGYSIIQAILDYDADTHVVGLAASMAGVISQFGKRRTANDFAQMMIHMPKGSDDEVLSIVRKNLIDMLTNRCGKTRDQIESWMEKETNFDAEQMLEIGFVDEIVRTNVVDRVSNSLDIDDRYKVFNQLISNQKMKNLLNHFELEASATETDILNAIKQKDQEYMEEKSTDEAQISKLQNELEEMRTEVTALRGQLAENLADQAIKDGKIEESKKEKWVEAASKDYELVKDQLESIKVVTTQVRPSVQNSYQEDASEKADKAVAAGTDKDVIDLFENEERQGELNTIRTTDFEKFEELSNRYLDITLDSK